MELNYNLQVNILQLKTDVGDLKIQALKRIKIRKIYAYEFWTFCFNSDSRSNSLADTLSLGQQIQRGVQGQALWSSTAVDLHGICSINLAQLASGYRGMPKCETRRTLSSGLSRASSQSFTPFSLFTKIPVDLL